MLFVVLNSQYAEDMDVFSQYLGQLVKNNFLILFFTVWQMLKSYLQKLFGAVSEYYEKHWLHPLTSFTCCSCQCLMVNYRVFLFILFYFLGRFLRGSFLVSILIFGQVAHIETCLFSVNSDISKDILINMHSSKFNQLITVENSFVENLCFRKISSCRLL